MVAFEIQIDKNGNFASGIGRIIDQHRYSMGPAAVHGKDHIDLKTAGFAVEGIFFEADFFVLHMVRHGGDFSVKFLFKKFKDLLPP